MKLSPEDFETLSNQWFSSSFNVSEKGDLQKHILELLEHAIDTLPLDYQRWTVPPGTIAGSMRHHIQSLSCLPYRLWLIGSY